jgi:hypothetical protein
VSVRLSDDDVAALDAVRGALTRAEFVRYATLRTTAAGPLDVTAASVLDPAVVARLLEPGT